MGPASAVLAVVLAFAAGCATGTHEVTFSPTPVFELPGDGAQAVVVDVIEGGWARPTILGGIRGGSGRSPGKYVLNVLPAGPRGR